MKNYKPHVKEIGLQVIRKNNESFESLLRRFKRKVSNDGILQELKTKRYFEKPSEKARRRMRQSIRKIKTDREKNMKNKI